MFTRNEFVLLCCGWCRGGPIIVNICPNTSAINNVLNDWLFLWWSTDIPKYFEIRNACQTDVYKRFFYFSPSLYDVIIVNHSCHLMCLRELLKSIFIFDTFAHTLTLWTLLTTTLSIRDRQLFLSKRQ